MKQPGLNRKNFGELFDLYYGDLVGFVFSYVNDREVARDLVHDVFFTLWKNRKSLDTNKSVKSYLFMISRNHALNYLKHRRVIALNDRELSENWKDAGNEKKEFEERLERMRKRLEQLSEKQREIVIKCCVEGKMYKEVATELNISENTVKTHLVRAMKSLRGEEK